MGNQPSNPGGNPLLTPATTPLIETSNTPDTTKTVVSPTSSSTTQQQVNVTNAIGIEQSVLRFFGRPRASTVPTAPATPLSQEDKVKLDAERRTQAMANIGQNIRKVKRELKLVSQKRALYKEEALAYKSKNEHTLAAKAAKIYKGIYLREGHLLDCIGKLENIQGFLEQGYITREVLQAMKDVSKSVQQDLNAVIPENMSIEDMNQEMMELVRSVDEANIHIEQMQDGMEILNNDTVSEDEFLRLMDDSIVAPTPSTSQVPAVPQPQQLPQPQTQPRSQQPLVIIPPSTRPIPPPTLQSPVVPQNTANVTRMKMLVTDD